LLRLEPGFGGAETSVEVLEFGFLRVEGSLSVQRVDSWEELVGGQTFWDFLLSCCCLVGGKGVGEGKKEHILLSDGLGEIVQLGCHEEDIVEGVGEGLGDNPGLNGEKVN
jgi:hypothetical protein